MVNQYAPSVVPCYNLPTMKPSPIDRAYQLFRASPALWSIALMVPLFDLISLAIRVKTPENVPPSFMLLLLFYCGKFFLDAALYGSFVQLFLKKDFKPSDFKENGFKYFILIFHYWAMVLFIGVILGIVFAIVVLILGIPFDELLKGPVDPFGSWNILTFFLIFGLVPVYFVPFQAILTGKKLWVSLGETWKVYLINFGFIFKFTAVAYVFYLACLKVLYLLAAEHEGILFHGLETLISSYLYVFLIPLAIIFLSDYLPDEVAIGAKTVGSGES